MAVILKQYNGSTVTATDDAIMYDTLSVGSGVVQGCEINYISLNNVSIAHGYMLVRGRLVEIEAETLSCDMGSSGNKGRGYLRIDLSDAEEPAKLLTLAMASLPALEQDENFNYDAGVYEVELFTYDCTGTAIENVVTTYKQVHGGLSVLDTKEEIMANTEPNRVAGALAVKEVYRNLTECLANGTIRVVSLVGDVLTLTTNTTGNLDGTLKIVSFIDGNLVTSAN